MFTKNQKENETVIKAIGDAVELMEITDQEKDAVIFLTKQKDNDKEAGNDFHFRVQGSIDDIVTVLNESNTNRG